MLRLLFLFLIIPSVAWAQFTTGPFSNNSGSGSGSISGITSLGGNIGISSTAPGQKLDVQGTIRAFAFQTGGSGDSDVLFAANASDVAIPPTGYGAIYEKTDKSLYFQDEAGLVTNLLSGTGGGGFSTSGTNVYMTTSTNNVGVGTTGPSAKLQLASTTQLLPRIILSGQEFFAAGNTDTSGMAFLLGVNRTGNRQLWIADSANLAVNATNPTVVITANSPAATVSAKATDGSTALALNIQSGGGKVGIGTSIPANTMHIIGNASIGYSGAFAAPTNGLLVAGNVGIATANNQAVLNIKGPDTSSSTVAFYINNSAGTQLLKVPDNGNSVMSALNINDNVNGDAGFTLSGNGALYSEIQSSAFNVAFGGNIILQRQGGNIGIGTITARETLEVSGSVRAAYKSSDGSAGITGSTCTAWKNGLCTSS